MAEEKKKKDAGKILGGKKSKKHGKVKTMHVHKATGGGFMIHHDMESEPENPGGSPSEDHIQPDLAGLQQHMAEHFGDHPAMGAGPAEEPQAAPAAAPGV